MSADFSDACVECPPGSCCVTMSADNITHGIEETAEAIDPLAGHLVGPSATGRLAGAVLVYQKPCPRNYQCPVGMVDDAKMV